MSGTLTGGKRAAQTLKKKDPDYYRNIGSIGGKKSVGGGVANDPEMAKLLGKLGGKPPKNGLSLHRRQQIIEVRKQIQELKRQRGQA